MKKIYLLSFLAPLLFSCTKEKTLTTPEQPQRTNVIKPLTLNPGNGATIAYDPISGIYKANYAGAELVFSPIPNNTNYTDGDVANTSVSCTNCTYFEPAANGRFVGSIPIMPAPAKESIHTQLSTYNKRFDDYIKSTIDTVTHTYKEPTIPNFPSVSSTYSAAVSGVIVRSHSSPSTCMVLPSTFIPNPVQRNAPPGQPFFIGSVASLLYPGTVYDFRGGNSSNIITSVQAIANTPVTITWSGTFSTVTNSSGVHHYVTVNIYHDFMLYERFTNIETSELAL